MKRTISILGSTCSIGRQTLDVAASCGFPVAALTVNSRVDLAEEQARRFRPKLVAVVEERAAADLKTRLADTDIRVLGGREGLLEAAVLPEADTVVTAVVGIAGLEPTLAAIDSGKRIALANKETLVCAGDLVMKRAKERGVDIVPVDSEHSAIFQCLQGCKDRREVRRLIITASGGPFYGKSCKDLSLVTKEQALKHPNWSMGAKITIDSATLMNKGLEFIEAMRLYELPPEQIDIAVHRESIVHSLVEFVDGAVLAQLGTADMRLPIQYALTWPERAPSAFGALNLAEVGRLTFEAPDEERFPSIPLAYAALQKGELLPIAYNAANEAAVARFRAGEIGFFDVFRTVEYAMAHMPHGTIRTFADILETDREARSLAEKAMEKKS